MPFPAAAVRRPPLLALLAVTLCYVATLLALEGRGTWIADNGNKLLQVQALLRNGYLDASLPWPGSELDPELAFNPLPPPFSVVRDGRIYSQYSPIFATLSTFPYSLFGPSGLYLLPLLGTLASLAAVGRLTGQLLAAPAPGAAAFAVLCAGLCTPLWFYSVVFWEHSLALAPLLWGLSSFLDFAHSSRVERLVSSVALVAASSYLREEHLLFFVPLLPLAAWLVPRGCRLRAVGLALATALLALAPLALYNGVILGSPLGLHAAANLALVGDSFLATRLGVAHRLLIATGSSLPLSALFCAPPLLALVLRPRIAGSRMRWLVPSAGLFAIALSLLFLLGFSTAPSPILQLLASNSLFPAAPWLVLGLFRLRDQRDGDRPVDPAALLGLLAVAYALLYVAIAPAVSSQGIHWGNRFLFPVYPILAVLATANLRRWVASRPRATARLCVAIALLLSLGSQLFGLHLLALKKDFSHRLNTAVAARHEKVVVTGIAWVPQELHRSFFDRQIFYVDSSDALVRLRAALRQRGHERYLLVTRDSRMLPPQTGSRQNEVVHVGDNGLEFFALYLLPQAP